MILICLLILNFFNFSFELVRTCRNYEYLSKGSTKRFNYWDYCILIYSEEFSGYFSFHVKVNVANGYFYHKILSYDGYAIPPQNGVEYFLTEFKMNDEEEYGKSIGNQHYDYNTLHYYVPKNRLSPYFIFSIPSFEGDYIDIQIETSGISIWGIIEIIVAAIVIMFIIIYIILYYKKRQIVNVLQQNQENPPNQPNQPNPPNQLNQPINAPLMPQGENSDMPLDPSPSIN